MFVCKCCNRTFQKPLKHGDVCGDCIRLVANRRKAAEQRAEVRELALQAFAAEEKRLEADPTVRQISVEFPSGDTRRVTIRYGLDSLYRIECGVLRYLVAVARLANTALADRAMVVSIEPHHRGGTISAPVACTPEDIRSELRILDILDCCILSAAVREITKPDQEGR